MPSQKLQEKATVANNQKEKVKESKTLHKRPIKGLIAPLFFAIKIPQLTTIEAS